jgi:hypothetical protein
MEIVDNGTSAEIEEILAQSTIARTSSLPPTNMGQGMLDRYSFTQFGSSFWRLLTLS